MGFSENHSIDSKVVCSKKENPSAFGGIFGKSFDRLKRVPKGGYVWFSNSIFGGESQRENRIQQYQLIVLVALASIFAVF